MNIVRTLKKRKIQFEFRFFQSKYACKTSPYTADKQVLYHLILLIHNQKYFFFFFFGYVLFFLLVSVAKKFKQGQD